MSGYAGRILKVNLTTQSLSTIPTARYAQWGGGHGMGSAIFWDLVKDKTISGFDPANVITIMTSPISGTLTPAASGRTEVQGIGIQSSPEWFTRSNFGGRFGTMLKHAGWDGVVIQGRAEKPVWIDIRDGAVEIRDARGLWGKDTWKTQEEIWHTVAGEKAETGWTPVGDMEEGRQTTQRPAVLTIGPAGENRSRIACLIHDAGNGAGQGGFGGVWGAKNLKAVSVIGTGSITIADPNAMMKARLWAKKYFASDSDDPKKAESMTMEKNPIAWGFDGPPIPIVFYQRDKQSRPQGCVGCHVGCRSRNSSGHGGESSCAETGFYAQFDIIKQSGPILRAVNYVLKKLGKEHLAMFLNLKWGKQTDAAYKATDLLQQYGINAFEMVHGLPYLRALHKKGVLGPGKAIDCDLDFDTLGDFEFIEKLVKMIAHRKGIGDDIAEGFYRAAKRWDRLEKDTHSGLLPYSYWGLPEHGYDPRAELEWGYGSILGDRDINEHEFSTLFWFPSLAKLDGREMHPPAEEMVKIFVEKMKPLDPDPRMLDYSTANMYSEHIAKLVSWHRYYTRFWKESAMYCDMRYGNFYNKYAPGNRGITGEGEPRFWNAVTGDNMSFVDGINLGRKIWNLDHAIWTLQGRHRDMVHFASYIYEKPFTHTHFCPYYMPGIDENGNWDYISLAGRKLDKSRFEAWKTLYYQQEGWDPDSGYPTRKTLTSLGLAHVAEALAAENRLGKG